MGKTDETTAMQNIEAWFITDDGLADNPSQSHAET